MTDAVYTNYSEASIYYFIGNCALFEQQLNCFGLDQLALNGAQSQFSAKILVDCVDEADGCNCE